MSENSAIIAERTLEYMSDGVLTIDNQGLILTFNPVAETLFALNRNQALGKTFAEVFLPKQENDDFNQTILDALYQTNLSHNQIISCHRGENVLTLVVTTSVLWSDHPDKKENIGVIAVFNNITKLEALRTRERELLHSLELQHSDLQKSYLAVDDNRRQLEVALKKVQTIRITATILVLVLFVSTGLYYWREFPQALQNASAQGHADEVVSVKQTYTVTPKPVSLTTSLSGFLTPAKINNVVSRLEGKVIGINFEYGNKVVQGQTLIRLETSKLEAQSRSAQALLIKATKRLRELENWNTGPEVSGAKRDLAKIKIELQSQQKKRNDTELLFNKGIIARQERDNFQQQVKKLEFDYTAAKESLRIAVQKGGKNTFKIATLEFENARFEVQAARENLAHAIITAPDSGIVMLPETSSQDKGGDKKIEVGSKVEAGDVLLSISKMDGFAIKSAIDEVSVEKIHIGQPVRVTGEAFANTVMHGEIKSISSQAKKIRDIPHFNVEVAIPQHALTKVTGVRLGMSADLEVIIYQNETALMAPIDAVHIENQSRWIWLQNSNGERKRVAIKTGVTTLDEVEVLDGLNAGDIISY